MHCVLEGAHEHYIPVLGASSAQCGYQNMGDSEENDQNYAGRFMEFLVLHLE